MMKKELSLSILVFVAIIAGCQRHQVVLPGKITWDGTWRVIAYQNIETNQVYTKSSTESGLSGQSDRSSDIMITLKQNKDTLQLNGHTVNNEVTGLFVLKAGDSLSCRSFGGTQIGEPNWGDWFWDAMYSVDAYQLGENILTFRYHFQHNHEGKWSVTLQRE